MQIINPDGRRFRRISVVGLQLTHSAMNSACFRDFAGYSETKICPAPFLHQAFIGNEADAAGNGFARSDGGNSYEVEAEGSGVVDINSGTTSTTSGIAGFGILPTLVNQFTEQLTPNSDLQNLIQQHLNLDDLKGRNPPLPVPPLADRQADKIRNAVQALIQNQQPALVAAIRANG